MFTKRKKNYTIRDMLYPSRQILGVIFDFRNTLIDVEPAYKKCNDKFLFSFLKRYNSKVKKKEFQALLQNRLKHLFK